jgi:tetratricopeptide (TPR) repeat protein
MRELAPLDWAMAQNNLGNTLFRLGEREASTVRLEEAVTALREALEVWDRDRDRMQWAMTQNNLGNALATLGEREVGTARLEERRRPPIAKYSKNGLATGCRFSGRGRRPISATRSGRGASGRLGRHGSKKRSWPFVRRLRN